MSRCPGCAKPTSPKAAKCAHCGRALRRAEPRTEHQAILCPRCEAATDSVTLATVELDLCRSCRGLWFDREELRHLRDAVSDEALHQQVLDLLRELGERAVRARDSAYLACPICHGAMPRINYATISGILLHRCPQHGTWADHDAALRVVELMANDSDASLRELGAARRDQKRADELERRLKLIESVQAMHANQLRALRWRTRVHLILDWFDFL